MLLIRILLVFTCLLSSTVVFAGEKTFFELGARGGVNDNRNDEDFTVGEIYLLRDLPWRLPLSEGVSLRTRFDAGGTVLEAAGEHSALLAIGGDLFLPVQDGHLELEIGLRPAYMNNYKFGGNDFGGSIQFASHAGMTLRWHNMSLSYRIQHISNASLYDHNRGMNLHLVGLGGRF